MAVAGGESINLKRKQILTSALCKYLSLDPGAYIYISGEGDIKSLYTNIMKSSGKWSQGKENDEVMTYIGFVESFPVDSQACFDALNKLNQDLAHKSVILGNRLTPSEADVIVFSVIHSTVREKSSHAEREKLTNVMRWMDYIQNKEDFVYLFEKILVGKPPFEPLLQGTRGAARVDTDSNLKKTLQSTKNIEKSETDKNIKKK